MNLITCYICPSDPGYKARINAMVFYMERLSDWCIHYRLCTLMPVYLVSLFIYSLIHYILIFREQIQLN